MCPVPRPQVRPLHSRDFYSLGAFFADVEDEGHFSNDRSGLDADPTKRVPEIPVHSVYQREKLTELDTQIVAATDRGDEQIAQEFQEQRDQFARQKSPTMISHSIEPRLVRIQARGDWQDESGEVVNPAVPAFLGKARADDSRASRLDLANWFTESEQGIGGLTARVMVNRYWALLFGEGLARVLDDFGGQGEPPSHPELLDNLAVEYVESGWDTKHIVKSIVMSGTYRQSSQANAGIVEHDPLNTLLARQNRFRLPAEAVRDTLLSVSGLIDLTVGGPSVRPYQPPKYYRYLNFPKREYEQDTGSEQWRRGVYMHWQRTFLHPDAQGLRRLDTRGMHRQAAAIEYGTSALVLLNDPNSVEAARAFASRDADCDIQRPMMPSESTLPIAKQFHASRLMSSEQIIADLLQASREVYAASPDAAEKLLSRLACPRRAPICRVTSWPLGRVPVGRFST